MPYAKTVTVFKDPTAIKRNASYLHWSPDGAHKVAAAYNILDFQMQPAGMSLSSYVWDLSNPNEPDFELCPTSQISCIKFNQKDANIVAAGQYNGQVTSNVDNELRVAIAPLLGSFVSLCVHTSSISIKTVRK